MLLHLILTANSKRYSRFGCCRVGRKKYETFYFTSPQKGNCSLLGCWLLPVGRDSAIKIRLRDVFGTLLSLRKEQLSVQNECKATYQKKVKVRPSVENCIENRSRNFFRGQFYIKPFLDYVAEISAYQHQQLLKSRQQHHTKPNANFYLRLIYVGIEAPAHSY